MTPQMQTAIVQAPAGASEKLPLVISRTEMIPRPPSAHHVLVRVLATALNPNDHKMIIHFPLPGKGAGCDFCGVVMEQSGNKGFGTDTQDTLAPGTRVCGTVFAYAATDDGNQHRRIGAFSEYVIADSRLLIQVPEHWSDLQGAALGGVGWSTVGLAMSHPDHFRLLGIPSRPAETRLPVLVYGGGTATGTMACQLLKLSGYAPIAVTNSRASAALAMHYGASGTVSTIARDGREPLDEIRRIAGGEPIRHALDCITDAGSASFCFAAIARTGGHYACLEQFSNEWRTRRVVSVKEVMGYQILGHHVDLGGMKSAYTREASEEAFNLGRRWAAEMQESVNRGLVEPHPVQEVPGRWDGILSGLAMLHAGKVRGRKLVVRISV
ncbi:Uu.00g134660.m01.CDS01 [Anthostomella pinea]|uniref:Uu.00g134660.m01.CDS01 n=1 Tax=Anthostomella pinea TaxID=933095 RepID=A0AAI8VNY9_9PEZI|nr:Uu.00g134660.m01.CDS01 [Anthostomella pinea]